MIAEVIERALDAGQESVKRGPDLLPVLREAGVVDAGGYALTVLLAGIVGALRGHRGARHRAPRRRAGDPSPARLDHLPLLHELRGHRHRRSSSAGSSHALEQIGDSVLVVGDQTTLKVHVHTDDPNSATALFAEFGAVSHLDVADMRAQVQQREARLSSPRGRRRRVRGARGGDRRRHALAVRGPRRAHARGRPDAQPLDLRPAGGDPRDPGRAGRGAPQQPQRGDGRRARRRAVGEDRRGRAVALAAGGARRRRQPRPRPRRRRERRGDGPDARAGAHRRGRARPPATTPRGGSARATRSGSSRRRSSPGAGPGTRCARCSSSWPRAPS